MSAIGFGAMNLSIWERPSEEQAVRVVHRALDLGISYIDTADVYHIDDRDKHHNEKLIRQALATYAGDTGKVLVGTKGGWERPRGGWRYNGSPQYLLKAIRASHAALGGQEPIALWQHHAPDPRVPIQESLRAAKEAVDEGLVRFVGVSNYSLKQLERAREVVEVVSVQNQYSPWHRQPERDGMLGYCESEGLTFFPWSPLGGSNRAGRLAGNRGLAALAREKGISVPRLVLAWLMARSPRVLPIPGARRVASIEDSALAPEVELSEDEVQKIDKATA
jgi:aryl-alcohol dehydrogenase-like predicted oxidoreductase